jgi:hypothetical protein
MTGTVAGVGSLGVLARSAHIRDQAIARTARDDFPDWVGHVKGAAACTRPIQLAGIMTTVEASTGRLLSRADTANMPDGVIYKACGNRRENVCPACSKVYRRDAYQIVKSLLVGGHGVPDTVAAHPAVFATFTAPSFGPVHNRVIGKHTCADRRRCDCRPLPCHARRGGQTCEHGRPVACFARHDQGDKLIGTPICPDCYDYSAHVVWNLASPELWRRTTIAIVRQLRHVLREHGLPGNRVKLSFAKSAEYQVRGVIHFHAVIRLDGYDPDERDLVLPPPGYVTAELLKEAVDRAAAQVVFTTDPHPTNPAGWSIAWGNQCETRTVYVSGDGLITDLWVVNYIAKYATKSTEATGAVYNRFTDETITLFADPDGTHTERLIEACWVLGSPKDWRRLRRAAHVFGFAGHVLTSSRRHKVTFTLLRNNRVVFRRTETTTGPTDEPGAATEQSGVLVVNFLQFVGSGWHTTADALLANTSAALAREHQTAAQGHLAALDA